jgi:hypothetical protein
MLRCVQPLAAVLLAAAILPPAKAEQSPGAFELARTGRSSAPGLHIKVVDADGAPVFPVDVSVEYDSGAPARGSVTADGFTVAPDQGRTVRAVTLASGRQQQRFPIEGTRANVLIFRH